MARLSRFALLGFAMLSSTALAGDFPKTLKLSELKQPSGFRLDGETAGDGAGYFALSGAGDVNGDGLDDFIIGGLGTNKEGTDSGSAYVLFGSRKRMPDASSLAALNGKAGFRIDGVASGDYAGISVAGAGDVNGDGFDDVIIGAIGANTHGSDSGAAYVVFGRPSAYPPVFKLSSLDGSNGFRLDGEHANDQAGTVSGTGDVNGDHFDDVLICAPGADNASENAGACYVVYGKGAKFPAHVNLTTLDGTSGFRINGGLANDRLSTAGHGGDINGDGFDDVVIAASHAYPNSQTLMSGGRGYVVFGRASGIPSSLNVRELGGLNGFSFECLPDEDWCGTAVDGAGDVNGDGIGDIIVRVRGSLLSPSAINIAYVMFGMRNGFPKTVSLGALNGSNGFAIAQSLRGNWGLGFAAAGAGDLNGDGYDDVAIGGHFANSSYVLFGKASFDASTDLALLDGENGLRIDGTGSAAFTGSGVVGGGDSNGDGVGDILIGSLGMESVGHYSGSTFVVHGRFPRMAVTRTGSQADQHISGGNFDDTLHGEAGRDVLEGRGGGDQLDGGLGIDIASYEHAKEAVTADLANSSGNVGDAAGDSYDLIEGLAGSQFGDTLQGNALHNVLIGNRGADRERGRDGNDWFVLLKSSDSPAGAGRDVIVDFEPGADHIDVSAIDAKVGVPRNQKFSFIGTVVFSHTRGELRVQKLGADVVVSGDVDGNAVADFEILLKNVNVNDLTAEDFRL